MRNCTENDKKYEIIIILFFKCGPLFFRFMFLIYMILFTFLTHCYFSISEILIVFLVIF